MTETIDDMIEFDLQERGVVDVRVLEAFRSVDRKKFVPELARKLAYDDRAVILSHGQTLSQPYIVGLMTQALELRGGERVLEVGTGSGFQTAILAKLAKEVFTVERIEFLATTAEDRLLALGFKNVQYHHSDGSLGWSERAPFDRIIVTAACPEIPAALKAQLADGGILVAPEGTPEQQELKVLRRSGGKFVENSLGPCVFVKLVGKEGFKP